MDEQQSTSAPTIGEALLDVFTAPSELFEHCRKTTPRHSLWIIPLIASIILGIAVVVISYTNETLRYQMLEIQRRSIEKQVEEGKLTKEQADRIFEGMDTMSPAFFIGFGAVGVFIVTCLYFLIASLILWVTSKLLLKSQASYIQHLEVYGLASFIGVLGNIISLLMMISFGSPFAQPALSIFIYDSFDITSISHRLLAAFNIFSLWQTAVIGIGVAKLSEKSLGYGLTLAFALWILWIPLSLIFNVPR
ncbi:MAG: YckD family protein [Bacteroidetes bacterium]|nr:YckD family protein [Bacteroidota bacterium]